jgi:hypothetical protein
MAHAVLSWVSLRRLSCSRSWALGTGTPLAIFSCARQHGGNGAIRSYSIGQGLYRSIMIRKVEQ